MLTALQSFYKSMKYLHRLVARASGGEASRRQDIDQKPSRARSAR
jgi:hypothetical protein